MKFNWCFVHEVDSQEQYNRVIRSITLPIEVTHQVIHYFWPKKSFTRALPKYPPQHFFDVT